MTQPVSVSRFRIQTAATVGEEGQPMVLLSISEREGIGFSAWLTMEESWELYTSLEKSRDEAERLGNPRMR